MYSVPKPQKVNIVNAIVAMTQFVGAILHLSTTDIIPDQDTELADFTECDFTGYAASSAIVWGSAYLDATGNGTSAGTAKTFVATGSTITNIAYTYYVTTALGAYLFGGRLLVPVNFAEAGDGVTLLPTFVFQGS